MLIRTGFARLPARSPAG